MLRSFLLVLVRRGTNNTEAYVVILAVSVGVVPAGNRAEAEVAVIAATAAIAVAAV